MPKMDIISILKLTDKKKKSNLKKKKMRSRSLAFPWVANLYKLLIFIEKLKPSPVPDQKDTQIIVGLRQRSPKILDHLKTLFDVLLADHCKRAPRQGLILLSLCLRCWFALSLS